MDDIIFYKDDENINNEYKEAFGEFSQANILINFYVKELLNPESILDEKDISKRIYRCNEFESESRSKLYQLKKNYPPSELFDISFEIVNNLSENTNDIIENYNLPLDFLIIP